MQRKLVASDISSHAIFESIKTTEMQVEDPMAHKYIPLTKKYKYQIKHNFMRATRLSIVEILFHTKVFDRINLVVPSVFKMQCAILIIELKMSANYLPENSLISLE